MNEMQIEQFIIENELVSIPELQKKFGLSYKEAYTFISRLLDQHKIALVDELHYTYSKEKEEIPPLYLKILWDCIKKDEVHLTSIITKYKISFTEAKKILKWMLNNKFINDPSTRKLLITQNDFIERYGVIEKNTSNLLDEEKQVIFRDYLRKLDEEQSIEDEEKTEASDSLEDKEPSDVFQLGLDLIRYETTRRKMKVIVMENPDITYKEFMCQIHRKHLNAVCNKSSEIEAYEKILNTLMQFEEEDFQDLKKILLS